MAGIVPLILFGALAIGALLLIVFLVRAWLFKREIVREFQRCNVIVAGKKGSGKDLLFQEVIRKRRKPYYANIDYGYKCEIVTCKDISVSPNTYRDFIENKSYIVDRRFAEKRDVYISDGGIFLPSYMDSALYKAYPSFPIYYALSRYLANHNIHVNVQNFGRVWKALREQADSYIYVKKSLKLPFFIFIKATLYDKYQSAEQLLEPVKVRFFNKHSKAETDIYHASNGYIKGGWVIVRKSTIKYDTRAFEKVIYGDSNRLDDSSLNLVNR